MGPTVGSLCEDILSQNVLVFPKPPSITHSPEVGVESW
jgi:hypothetical protein